MKNLKIFNFLSIVALLSLVASGAWAYQYDDNTNVERFWGSSVYGSGYWSNVIGHPNDYNTLGGDFSSNTNKFTIYTNWNPGKDGQYSGSGNLTDGIRTADLFIDNNSNGTFDYAIRLDTSAFANWNLGASQVGKVFTASPFNTSQDLLSGSGLFYGGLYDNQGSPSLAPVWATSGSSGLTIPVTWTYGTWTTWTNGSGYVNNQVAVDLSGLNLGNNWSFFWGTGICSNDAFAGNVSSVPEPSILLLLGVGLIGLGGFRRKFKGNQ